MDGVATFYRVNPHPAGIFGANAQGIEVVAEFHGATCEAEAFHTVTIID